MHRALVIVNPKASQAASAYEAVVKSLAENGISALKAETSTPASFAKALGQHRNEIDLVVVGGGDGSVRLAAESILQHRVPLGIIPLGTANNVARSLQIPLTIEGACQTIAQGKKAPMDLGRVNGRLFVSVAGIGFSTDVHEEVPAEQKKRWGSLSYAWQACRTLVQSRQGFHAEITTDDQRFRVKALQITVCNGRYYGAHIAVHPEATLDDGLLDLSVIESENFIKGFIKALLPMAPHPKSRGLRLARSTRFNITTHSARKIDVEGETDLRTPASFEILPAAIEVMVPAK